MVIALLTGNEFAFIHAFMMGMCITIKTKAIVIPLVLGFIGKYCSQNNRTLSFSSLNISGVRKCKYGGTYKHQSYHCLFTSVNSEILVFRCFA